MCARSLLGADPWRNAAVIRSELGWQLTGRLRLLRDAACRQARLQCLEPGDLYKELSDAAVSASDSWSSMCSAAIHKAGVIEWQGWASAQLSLSDYRKYVTTTLAANAHGEWQTAADRHSAQVPYRVFQPLPSRCMALCRQLLNWDEQLAVRSWCRLRSGLICLRHLNGRESAARYQMCVFCDRSIRNATVHCLSFCSVWECMRARIVQVGDWSNLDGDKLALQVLGCQPGSVTFSLVLELCVQVDKKASAFWLEHR